MMKRVFIWGLAIWTMCCWVSCAQQELPEGEVNLIFTVGDPVTRAATPGDGNPADGGGIAFDVDNPDLVVLITKMEGGVETLKSSYVRGTGSNATATILSGDSKQKQIQVTFTGIEAGDYSVYAIANTKNGESTVWGAPSDWNVAALSSLLADASINRTDESVDNDRPTIPNSRMPLSAKCSLTVKSSGSGSVSLELLRCVSKVTVKFKNVTGGTLDLNTVKLYISDMNPAWGYLIPPSTGADSPTSAGVFHPLEMSAATMNSISETGTEVSGTYYVFPSAAQGGTYYCSTSFGYTLTPEGGGASVSSSFKNGYYDYEAPATSGDYTKGLRIHNSQGQDIPALQRNQHLTIEIRIGKGESVSFNFIVANWNEKEEEVTFN